MLVMSIIVITVMPLVDHSRASTHLVEGGAPHLERTLEEVTFQVKLIRLVGSLDLHRLLFQAGFLHTLRPGARVKVRYA